MLPKFYADFHKLDDENRIVLTTLGTKEDLQRLGIELAEGMPLTFYMDDAADEGHSDDIMVDGTAHFSAADRYWVAAVDWDAVYHGSEQSIHVSVDGGPSKQSARDV